MLEKDKSHFHNMPDIASEPALHSNGQLESVGMSGIEVPVSIIDSQGKLMRIPALAEASVNLHDEGARGIHMSRLFKLVQEAFSQKILNLELLSEVSLEFLNSHQGLSNQANLSVSFSAMLERKALKSSNTGWRSYPVSLSVHREADQAPRYFVEVLVTYASTCPASAALSRQLIQNHFAADFSEAKADTREVFEWLGSSTGIVATPHAQRSYAKVKVQVKNPNFEFLSLIDLIEEVLQTPVQTAVKREDEQEFALRNGQNLMFCEDAARRVQSALLKQPELVEYEGEFRHVESLHPHDAVAKIRGSV